MNGSGPLLNSLSTKLGEDHETSPKTVNPRKGTETSNIKFHLLV